MRLLSAVPFLLAAAFCSLALAQSYPAKAVRIVIPYPPGGGADTLGRPIAQKLSERWGQPVPVDNRGGASGMIGADIVAKSAPDGYTVLLCSSAEVALNVALFQKMSYDPLRDFTPVTLLAAAPLILVAHPSLPAGDIREFVALVMRRPGEIGYATAGTGSPQHITGEWMRMLGGVNMIHVPYKGGGPQLTDLLGGSVHTGFLALPISLPHLAAGKLRALAVSTAARTPAAPQVPTLAESGFAGLDVSQWWGVLVPSGTPAEIVARLHADIAETIRLPDIRANMTKLGAEPSGMPSAQFGAYLHTEVAKFRKIVSDAGIKPQ